MLTSTLKQYKLKTPQDPNTDPGLMPGGAMWGGIQGTSTTSLIDIKWTHIDFAGGTASTTPPDGYKSGANLFDIFFQNPHFLGAAAHARLTHEDDARQQDGFECYEGAEKRVGWRIEVARVGERGCVEDHPSRRRSPGGCRRREGCLRSRRWCRRGVRMGCDE